MKGGMNMENLGRIKGRTIQLERYERIVSQEKYKDEEYNKFVTNLERKIEKFIREKDGKKTYHTSSINKYLKIEVDAIPLTKKQMNDLLCYLKIKYIKRLSGNNFRMRKSLLFKTYIIETF